MSTNYPLRASQHLREGGRSGEERGEKEGKEEKEVKKAGHREGWGRMEGDKEREGKG